MGEVIEKIHTFVLPNETNLYTFKTSFVYDSWNRLIEMTYPDGEILDYVYNCGGILKSMSSQYNNLQTTYISNIKYDKFEQKTDIYYGNGTETHYTYDNIQRLSTLLTQNNTEILQNIDYTYDNANNISTITNNANYLQNNIGGRYTFNYEYDDLYRLTSYVGAFYANSMCIGSRQSFTYQNDGRISYKKTMAGQKINNNLNTINKNTYYNYSQNQPHTISNIYNSVDNSTTLFGWDANGNMIRHHTQFPQDNMRQMCLDEENRLMAVGDNKYTSYYVYDNGGERTYKLTGPNTLMNINGNWMNFAYMDNPTLYTSAYLVANVQGYTKHYYAGSERIASAIGLGGLSTVNNPIALATYNHKWENKSIALKTEMIRTIELCLNHRFSTKKTLANLYNLKVATPGTMNRYFYHPDHLGSSSWITDGSGNAIQHLHYLPFGEDWVDQRNSSWNVPYTFSGKEKDAETGYGYFGARYYDSGLSIWLSVDPMSDKYPSMSPYIYCANNPVILVDPDGRKIVPTLDFLSNCGFAYYGLQYNSTYLSLTSVCNNENNNVFFYFGLTDNETSYGQTSGDHNANKTKYDLDVILNKNKRQSEIGQVKTILHELVHVNNKVTGQADNQDHSGFDQAAVLAGLIEYNDTFNKGYTKDQLEIISWSGCQNSPEFKQYITDRAKAKDSTYDLEYYFWKRDCRSICETIEEN